MSISCISLLHSREALNNFVWKILLESPNLRYFGRVPCVLHAIRRISAKANTLTRDTTIHGLFSTMTKSYSPNFISFLSITHQHHSQSGVHDVYTSTLCPRSRRRAGFCLLIYIQLYLQRFCGISPESSPLDCCRFAAADQAVYTTAVHNCD